MLAFVAGVGAWAWWRAGDERRGREGSAGAAATVAVASGGGRAAGERVAIPAAREGFSFSPPAEISEEKEKKRREEEEEALADKTREVLIRRAMLPRTQARRRVMERGFDAVMEHRIPLKEAAMAVVKEHMDYVKSKQYANREEMEKDIREKGDALRSRTRPLEEAQEEYRQERLKWQRAENAHAQAAARAEVERAGGETPPPETEKGREVEAGRVADPMLNTGYRAAADRMAAGDFSGAARGFAEVAGTAQGRFQEEARWNGMLNAMAAGEEGMVTEAARELLRGSASTAAFAMAALAMRDGDWEEAQIWVDQAAAEGDAGENETLGKALRGMGWMEAGALRVAGPE